MNKIKIIIAALSLLVTFSVYSQGEGDKIIAIVGNDIVLQSDLNFQLYTYMQQNNIQEISNDMVQQVFQNLVSEKLMLAKAEQDSIFVSSDEVNKQVEGRIKDMIAQFGSEKNVEEAYGLTIPKIRNLLKDQTERNIKLNRVKQAKFGYGINVTKPEVTKFYNDYKDSLPMVPETYDLSQIIRIPKITEDAKFMAREKAEKILDSLKAGGNFDELAKRNSDDSLSAIQGGALGKSKKGSFVKEFEDAAFLLKPGEISGIVESEFGYHIIKLNDKTGDFITCQHILVKFPRLEAADFTEINFLKDLKDKINSGQITFNKAAIEYSQDPKSAADSGHIGKLSVNNLDPLEVAALNPLSIGGISDPVKVGDERYYGYYMYRVNDKFPEHKATLESDYVLIEQYAQKFKEQKMLGEWLEELKKTIYLEIKL
ncbi:MAG TPA: peptidylprolyl isomerase [Ignavibacteria bacterium]|nr:peptidylprolyl isomerase [Ignavibacteria bacterium]HMQ99056.1 peptidylprolyl isomerase [Ignavibacteria bacterium]